MILAISKVPPAQEAEAESPAAKVSPPNVQNPLELPSARIPNEYPRINAHRLERFFDHERDKAVNFLTRRGMPFEDARDLLQDIFREFLSKQGELPEAATPYIFATLRNRLNSWLRQQYSNIPKVICESQLSNHDGSRASFIKQTERFGADSLFQAIVREEWGAVSEVVGAVLAQIDNKEQINALITVYVFRVTPQAAADALNTTGPSIHAHAERGKKKILEILRENYPDYYDRIQRLLSE